MRPELEISIGVVLSVMVAVLLYESFNPLYEGFGEPEFPPMRFPRWILLGIGALTALHLVRAFIGKVESDPIFFDTLWRRVLMVAIVTIIAALLIKPLGFAIASALAFWVVAALVGYRNYLMLTVFTILFVIITWALFTFVINIGLPTSPFFNRI